MAKYNLIRNGSLEALTTSGTGNKALTWSQLESLIDGTTISGGVTVASGDALWLEADLSNRIKVDGIYLYASDPTKLSNIDFYYKNSAGENYTACSKNVSTYYYATIPSPSAPQYIMATISGIAAELYEFQIFNDDYIVGFGSDGSLLAKYLEDAAIGETSAPETIAIFNNSTASMAADAYICIDYTGSNADDYLRIASTVNGPWYSISDGALLEDNKDSSIYRWDMGSYNNTTTSGDNVVLTDPTTSGGVYTSPIFKLDNQYNASYFVTDGTTKSGTSSISYDPDIYNGTIRVKSSNTEPLVVDEVFWIYGYNPFKIAKCIIYNGDQNNTWQSPGARYARFTAVNRRNGDVAISYQYYYNFNDISGHVRIYNRAGDILYTTAKMGHGKYINTNMEFDKYGGIWGYGTNSYLTLVHYDNELDDVLYSLNDGTDFLYDLAVEMDGDGVWYTNKIDNLVIHKSTDGTTLHTIALNEPRAICGTLAGGCWVIDNADEKAYRYNSSGSLVKTVNLEREAERMTTDMADGFWYLSGNYVYHVTSGGTENVSVNLNQPTRVKGGYNGCIVWSSDNDWVKYIDNNGNVTRTFTISGVTTTACPALFSFRHADFVEFKDTTNIIPASYDPLWGTGGSLEWKEVRKDGYFLPKVKYHQIEVTLRNNDGSSTPTLKKLIMPPAVKIQDISAQTSKNVYIKTVIPDGADITDYETRLKTWWGVNA